MTAAIMMNVPGRSIWRSFSCQVAFAGLAAGGVVKRKNMIAALRPPIGRLM